MTGTKVPQLLAACLLAVAIHPAMVNADPIAVFSTGQVPGGGLLVPPNTADGNYVLSLAPAPFAIGVPAFALSPLAGLWAPNRATSQWINPDGLSSPFHPGGSYAYTTVFSLAGFIPTSTVIELEWIADDNFVVPGAVSLNGFVVSGSSPPPNGWTDTDWTAVTISTATLPAAAFLPGLNALTFTVTNQQTLPSPTGPTGLQVDILYADATPIPEPTTLGLLAFSLLMLFRFRRQPSLS